MLIKIFDKYYSMRLEINGERLIAEVQSDFSKAYPFLKVEFFRNSSVRKDRYAASQLISQNKKIREAWRPKKEEGFLDFSDSTTVLELETDFMDQFGLSAQIYRKSGNVWLQSIITDNLSLKQQNDHGREITLSRSTINDDKDLDYDLMRDADH